jgi:hypothetical protein
MSASSLPAGALLVEPRILRRVIRRHRGISDLGLAALHGHCYTLPKADLLRLAEPAELGVAADALADTPILLPSDTPAARVAPRVFHARVHQALATRRLTPALVRERVHRIGQTEFDEIRFILRQDDLLLPPRDDAETYVEFAAMYLELKTFLPAQLARTFPTLHDTGRIERLLAEDVDAAALLDGLEVPAAPAAEPAAAPRALTRVAAPVEPGLAPAAAAARARGNLVRSAILAQRAGLVDAVRADLDGLAGRLGMAERAAWADALLPFVQAASGHGAVARFLLDLQKAAIDLEREALSLHLIGWAVTLGRQPLATPLPAARELRYARHLAQAAAKLAKLPLGEETVAPLRALLHDAIEHADAAVRAELQPRVAAVLDEVRLVPANLPETVARAKLVAELGDGVLERGFLGLGHVRDALSRNQLKLDDLSGPGELVRGDALLGIDRRLTRPLAGVYRRAEVYLRGLQKLSSVFFGTRPGRLVTMYAILPFLAASMLLKGLAEIVGIVAHLAFRAEVEIFSWPLCFGLTALAFGLIHSAAVRRGAGLTLHVVGLVLRFILLEAPRALWRAGPVRAVLGSWPARLAGRYVVKPALLAAVVVAGASLFHIERRAALILAGACFVAWNLVLNSRVGARAEEIAADWALRTGRHLGKRLLPGLFRLIVDVFKVLIEAIDRAIYAVDELLRFHRGESRLAMVVKGTLGIAWGVVTYILRIYINLLIEPTVNPIKHFPIVTVSGKIIATQSPKLIAGLYAVLLPLLGKVAASSIAATTVVLLPGFFGFLAWELKENWRLYRANRPRELRPVPIGHHGETMSGLMKPGLHSGTVPKLYAKLRRASWKGKPEAGKHRAALHHLGESIERFVERDLAALLAAAPGWGGGAITVGPVEIGSNQIRVGLGRDGARATLAFDEQSGWVVAGVLEPGWIPSLGPEDRDTLCAALAGLYKLAAVDLVREQLAPLVPAPHDIADEGLVVWPGSFATEVVYPLDDEGPTLVPAVRGEPPAHPPAPLAKDRLLFARQPVTWAAWVARWSGGAGPLIAGLLPP